MNNFRSNIEEMAKYVLQILSVLVKSVRCNSLEFTNPCSSQKLMNDFWSNSEKCRKINNVVKEQIMFWVFCMWTVSDATHKFFISEREEAAPGYQNHLAEDKWGEREIIVYTF